ncbi:hypothetical protein GE061_008466 [Apolygus lucorum]|uniref:RING-type domain-containing protein n=1 Tax=Apolygus lucorum TaxID=248454 RepID=A0A8S9WR62_APOLU|nr:hypothetical protein GE061_008466 [Apolygus lucorum]
MFAFESVFQCIFAPSSPRIWGTTENADNALSTNTSVVVPSDPAPPYMEVYYPVYYPSPSIARTGNQLTEDEQVKIALRIGLIQNLPEGKYGDCEINTECVICMIDFVVGDHVRYLPCLHTYHVRCIDDWLMRRFTCPSCMEPVDTGTFDWI